MLVTSISQSKVTKVIFLGSFLLKGENKHIKESNVHRMTMINSFTFIVLYYFSQLSGVDFFYSPYSMKGMM